MSWLVNPVNKVLLALGDAAQWLWHDGLGAIGSGIVAASDLANPVLAPLFRWINVPVNAVAGLMLAPTRWLPGWLSNTIISAVTGVLLLVIFKYTSNQAAIGRVKDNVKAHMLALKLFKDELRVTFSSQGRVFLGALNLLRYALVPLLVMIVPVSLELAQMGVWYQWRPLATGEKALVTMQLADTDDPILPLPEVDIASIEGADVTLGPIRIKTEREVCWEIQAREAGRHTIVFEVEGQRIEKALAVGDGFVRVSAVRPAWSWPSIVLHPLETPFPAGSTVRSISIAYPSRDSWTSGSDAWVIYFFVASMAFALVFKPFLKVKI